MKRFFLIFLCALFLMPSLRASSTSNGSIEISKQKIVFLKGAEVGAGYLTIVQTSLTSDKLVGAKIKSDSKEENKSFFTRLTSIFSRDTPHPLIELHDHIPSADNPDVMTMKPIKEGVEIPAGSKDSNGNGTPGKPVNFERSGKHLMLYHFPETIRNAPETEVILTFEKAGDVTIIFPINPVSSEKEKPCPCHNEASS